MARSEHGAAMMKRVLRHGGDINQRVKVLHWPRQGYWLRTDYFCTTPLLVFLDSVRSWKYDSGLNVIEGLEFLFKHGATLPLPDLEEPGDVLSLYKYTKPPLPADLLLARWGLQTLNRPRFLDVIRYLVRHGSRGAGFSPEEVATMIAQHAGFLGVSVETEAIFEGRALFMNVLLEGRTTLESTKVLDWLLVKTGRTVDTMRPKYGQVLECLVAVEQPRTWPCSRWQPQI